MWDENLETSQNPNITGEWSDVKNKRVLSKKFQTTENFIRMLDWVEENKIPCRIAFNAIKELRRLLKTSKLSVVLSQNTKRIEVVSYSRPFCLTLTLKENAGTTIAICIW